MTIRQLVEQRIRDAGLGFKEVAGAADLSNITSNRVSLPGCYIFRQRNNAGQNELIHKVLQEVTETIAVIVITRNVRDSRGGDSSDENELYCKKIQDLLLNWSPSSDYYPLEYAGGSLVTFRDGLFVWQENYKTSTQIQSII